MKWRMFGWFTAAGFMEAERPDPDRRVRRGRAIIVRLEIRSMNPPSSNREGKARHFEITEV
jgi:hypothetical protein